ncbi:CapA family protein [Kineococcus rhizosphaerae]|uniref:Poly-gamma-glutamate synthesis protein (Capsule biosynthesis protein) n=1 Tax=Kineococcus rhizosphaerae TaxID=559628 RepID=A0A2T0QX76_9ACTN|nr:CapA family protein [Kineococcus rhizosphaerae]PRY10075.1 poly-gamma-glutamate synthesis protein (capsule biosynthesis protein) [Kineococcus rhizosphaerae]
MRKVCGAVLAVSVLVVAGCSSPEDPAGPDRPAPRPVTIAVAGDVHFDGTSEAALEPGGLQAVAPLLEGADLAVVNVETAITDRGSAAGKKYTFRAPAKALGALKAAGVDVAAMANNHSLDYGRQGLSDTLAAGRSEGLPIIGLGTDADAAFAPHRTTVKDNRVAVFDATQVVDSSLATAWTATDTQPGLASVQTRSGRERLVAAVEAERSRSDSVVVVLHWGKELQTCPTDDQRGIAEELVAAGADAVVGSHAHVQLGQGYLEAGGKKGFVDYGLGNFVFYAKKGAAVETGVLELTLPGTGGVSAARWQPATIRSGVPVPLEGDAATKALRHKESLRACADLAAS